GRRGGKGGRGGSFSKNQFVPSPPPSPRRPLRETVVGRRGLNEEAGEGVGGVDATDGLAEDPAHRELDDLLTVAGGGRERDGVGHHQLLDGGLADALDGRTAEHRVDGVGYHPLGALVE